MNKFGFGNDFEAFIYSHKEKKIVNAIHVLEGHGKDNPIHLGNGVDLFYDNMLLEFNFQPYFSKEEMIERLRDAFQRVVSYLGIDYTLILKAGHTFEEAQVDSDEARLIGCMPSFDAYTVSVVTNEPFESPFRSSGGHWHISGKLVEPFDPKLNAVKLADIYLGCTNVLCVGSDKTEVQRRKIYGKSGNHRCPAHGGYEYRSLSSSFLNSKPLTELTFDLLNFSLAQIENGSDAQILASVQTGLVRSAIDECDQNKAMDVLKAVQLPQEFMSRVMEKRDMNFYGSWNLETKAPQMA